MMNPSELRDALTGLGNLAAARAVLQESIERKQQVALLYCDVDHFKDLNEFFGHKHGDEELCRIARDLEQICAPFPVCRFGGDEFIVLLPKHSREEAREVAQRILASQPPVAMPYFGGSPVQAMSFSIGFALFPEHALSAENLLQAADVALFKCKRGGRLPDGSPYAGRNRAMTWGDFLDEFPDQSAQFLNPDFVGPRV